MVSRNLSKPPRILYELLACCRPAARILLALALLRVCSYHANSRIVTSCIGFLKTRILLLLQPQRHFRQSTCILPSTEPSKRQRLVIKTHALSDTPYISPSGHLTPNSPPSPRRTPLAFEYPLEAGLTEPPTPAMGNEGDPSSDPLP